MNTENMTAAQSRVLRADAARVRAQQQKDMPVPPMPEQQASKDRAAA